MARFRLLFALSLLAIGTMFGALALSGYYDPRAPHNQAMSASSNAGEGAHFIRRQPRQRFVAADSQATLTPAKAKSAKSPREAKPIVKDKQPRQTAAEWPWGLFSN